MVNQNKIFSFEIKRQTKNVFPRYVKRTVVSVLHTIIYLWQHVMAHVDICKGFPDKSDYTYAHIIQLVEVLKTCSNIFWQSSLCCVHCAVSRLVMPCEIDLLGCEQNDLHSCIIHALYLPLILRHLKSIYGPRQAKRCLRTLAKCTDSRFILLMCKVSSGHLLSIDTFYNKSQKDCLGNKEHITDRKWKPLFYWDFISSNEVCNTV